ncbi:hypothetical protein BwSF12_40240 [Bradyrhizobium ottawaense]|nr:hypothetical protein BwSF12_40240 [Bradyrhizobium ottawaense]
MRGDVEIDRRRRLRRAGVGSVGHGYSGGEGGKQDAASIEHGFSPWLFYLAVCRDGTTSAGSKLRFVA